MDSPQEIQGAKWFTATKSDGLVKSQKTVTPAKAGVHNLLEYLDSRVRGNDRIGARRTFYEVIKS